MSRILYLLIIARSDWKQPGAVIKCKLGWTLWIMKGMGYGNGPRTKRKGKLKVEMKQEDVEVEASDLEGTSQSGTPEP